MVVKVNESAKATDASPTDNAITGIECANNDIWVTPRGFSRNSRYLGDEYILISHVIGHFFPRRMTSLVLVVWTPGWGRAGGSRRAVGTQAQRPFCSMDRPNDDTSVGEAERNLNRDYFT
jgi:hypothetical protein